MAHPLAKIKTHKTGAMKIFGTFGQNHDGLHIRRIFNPVDYSTWYELCSQMKWDNIKKQKYSNWSNSNRC